MTTKGPHYHFDGYTNFPAPVQRPHPPLLIGAGSRHMLELAGREADIVGVLPKAMPAGSISDDPQERLATTLAQKIDWIRAAAGERFAQIELSLVATLIVTESAEERAQALMRARGWSGVTTAQVLAMPTLLIGTIDEICAKLYQVRAELGFSYFVFADAAMESAAPIVALMREN